ncbi:hypothetical protein [Pseudonocardia parietis]|uniref:Homeodomain-like domain-containing protein n=1 Tax=Pseudonocardia parietis TaxID=570936 RepID=A0ABS4W229_9PSEU|nr:hypothetical protein [Pseudonocardia parietis]MBP2370261.1 hypothetical protein [Pseudonocardia parietis]
MAPLGRCVSYNANPDWVDDVIVEQAVAGHRTSRTLTEAERVAAAHELDRRGHSLNVIATRLHVSAGTARHLLTGEWA